MTGKVSEGTLLDKYGLPITLIAGNKEVHFPIAVFQYGLGCYDKWLETGAEEFVEKLSRILNYAIENQNEDGSWNCFEPIGSSLYTVSSMCQGEGASLLIRGYKLFDRLDYLEAAKKAVDFMLLPLEQGGTSICIGNELFLEEYPQKDRISVLNGWIFSLFGIYDLSLLYPEYGKCFAISCETLREHIGEYDTGYWSYYDVGKRIASPAYHDLHIELLKVMNELYPCTEFKKYAEIFQKYQMSKYKRNKAIMIKIIQKLTEHSDSIVVQ